MSSNEVHIVPKLGYGMGYQESVDIEARCLFGMTADEFYRRQVGLILDEAPDSLYGNSVVLNPRKLEPSYRLPDGVRLDTKATCAGMQLVDKFNLGLGPKKKVLDLAVGEGDTSRYLATSGADIEAREIEPFLVTRGKERDLEVREAACEISGIQNNVRKSTNNTLGSVNYDFGDYSRIKESVGEKDKFDAITCLSRSFIYLGERENYVNALKDFYDLLAAGGKIVLQSRAHIKSGNLPWSSEMGTSLGKTPEGYFCMNDERSGTKFVWRTDQSTTTLSDGVKQSLGSRYLQYKDGTVKDLGHVKSDDHLHFSNLEDVGKMLREAGFKNLRIKVENLSSDGTEIMFAVVAEKPHEKAISKPRFTLLNKIKKLLGM